MLEERSRSVTLRGEPMLEGRGHSVTLRGEHAADTNPSGLSNTSPKHTQQKLRETQNQITNKPAPRNGYC